MGATKPRGWGLRISWTPLGLEIVSSKGNNAIGMFQKSTHTQDTTNPTSLPSPVAHIASEASQERFPPQIFLQQMLFTNVHL